MVKKSYCNGQLCRVTDRKVKCQGCGLYVCRGCSVIENAKTHCIDCHLDMKLIQLKHKVALTIEDFTIIDKVKKHKARH